MNRFRERYNELLEIKFRILDRSDENDSRLKTLTFIILWCDQKAAEIETMEFIKANTRTIKGTPDGTKVESGITGFLNITFPDNRNKKKLKQL